MESSEREKITVRTADTLLSALHDNATFGHDPKTALVVGQMVDGQTHFDFGPACALWTTAGDASSVEKEMDVEIYKTIKLIPF